MVPIVEQLNHECTDVYYDFDYKNDNPKKPNVFFNLLYNLKFIKNYLNIY
jgi:hypothetical protein